MLFMKRFAVCILLAAIIMIFTFFFKIPLVTGGYIHLGDAAIYLAASVLGPIAAFSAAFGSALADFVGGYYVFIAPTFIIKGLMGWIAGYYISKADNSKRFWILILCEGIMVVGYFFVHAVIHEWSFTTVEVSMDCLQAFAGILVGIFFCALGDHIRIEGGFYDLRG